MIFEFGRRESLAPFICAEKSFRKSDLRFLWTECVASSVDSVAVSAMDWHGQCVEATWENSNESSTYDIGFEFAFVNPIADSAAINTKELRHFFY
jgi:hypothetical protein